MAKRRRKPKQREEGIVLLVVLFVLMMATGTAVFTLQATQYEMRAAGGAHQAMRTRYVAEAATVTYQSMCAHGGSDACSSARSSGGDFDPNLRIMYGFPNWGSLEPVYSFDERLLTAGNANEWPAPAIPRDSLISGGGTAAPYTPSVSTFVEVWPRPDVTKGGPQLRTRLIVSSFGALNYDPDNNLATVDDVIGTGELRQAHQTISATRAFIDM